jgi:isopentenyl diphosphate isomerase/L-lactate dehydrogenase-like FMN-dependent dehydrogenase
MTGISRNALNIEDLRRMAQRRLTRAIFEFIDRGSEDDVALRHNREAIEQIKLRPRVLNDVSGRDPAISLFGQSQKLPIVIGPTGPAVFAWYRGEIALARAAARAGIPFTLASTSNTTMERVIAEAVDASGSTSMSGATWRPHLPLWSAQKERVSKR